MTDKINRYYRRYNPFNSFVGYAEWIYQGYSTWTSGDSSRKGADRRLREAIAGIKDGRSAPGVAWHVECSADCVHQWVRENNGEIEKALKEMLVKRGQP